MAVARLPLVPYTQGLPIKAEGLGRGKGTEPRGKALPEKAKRHP